MQQQSEVQESIEIGTHLQYTACRITIFPVFTLHLTQFLPLSNLRRPGKCSITVVPNILYPLTRHELIVTVGGWSTARRHDGSPTNLIISIFSRLKLSIQLLFSEQVQMRANILAQPSETCLRLLVSCPQIAFSLAEIRSRSRVTTRRWSHWQWSVLNLSSYGMPGPVRASGCGRHPKSYRIAP